MKKRLLVSIFFAFVLSLSFSADVELTSSVLVPMEVYVGDTAELRCFLSTQRLLLSEGISEDSIIFEDDEAFEDFSLKKIELKRADGGYYLSVFFTPWKPGRISLPVVDLSFFSSVIVSEKDIVLELPSVNVGYVSEKLNANELRPIAPPILVPGTIYVVYVLIALFILFLIFLIYVCSRFNRVSLYLRNLLSGIKFSRNYRKTLKRLKKLSKAQKSDVDFASDLEKILRLYLETRFAHPFHSVTTSEIAFVFDDIFVGMLSDEQQQAIDEICILFRRCDYIRYAPNVTMEDGERITLINNLTDTIAVFEKEEN